MSQSSHRGNIGAACCLLPLILACGNEAEATSGNGSTTATLKFSAIPDDDLTALTARNQIVANYLSNELGVPVEFVPTSDYGASVEAFKNGDIHLAWFGGVSGVRARKAVPGATAIAQGKVDPNYFSYFIANASTGIERSDDFPTELEGKTFTFGSNGSTSGRCMPEYFIRQNTGKSPAEFFGSEPAFSGSHDLTAKQVEDGTYDAGALSYKTYDKMVAEGSIDPEVCRIIWKTPTYADYNFTVRPDVDEVFSEGFTQKLTDALVNCQDQAVLDALLRSEGLIPAKNSDFDKLAQTMASVGL